MSRNEEVKHAFKTGIQNKVKTNLAVPLLIEEIISRKEGVLTSTGAICTTTGKYTGRSPSDKFIVYDDISADTVDWGNVNKQISEDKFEQLLQKVSSHLNAQPEIFSFKGFVGADENDRLPIEVINEYAWHNLFARQLFIAPNESDLQQLEPTYTILAAPKCIANPETDGTNSEAFIIVSLKIRIILIGGTEYAGEMKKAIFSIMNYLLPAKGVLPMHCSANVGATDDVALFFGLSGTGKTTLSADANRKLVGDDEHGWGPNGVFNIEGGCYAKCDNLSMETEPEIYRAIRFGAILENVILDETTREPVYTDTSLTENTRVAYSIKSISNSMIPSVAGHPSVIIFLTADASGILPPVSKLTANQAMYHFLSGYTSKLAGTERGITKPEATFSACFGAPFLPLDPLVYAKMLGNQIAEHQATVFLVNTGWTGGEYGVGSRIKLVHTRSIINAILGGELADCKTITDAIFGLAIPTHVSGVPDAILEPRNTWSDKKAYDQQAKRLAKRFHENFKSFNISDPTIQQAGPLFQ